MTVSNLGEILNKLATDYGGVYIGSANRNEISCSKDKKHSDPLDNDNHPELHIQTHIVTSKRTTESNGSRDQNSSAMIHDPTSLNITTHVNNSHRCAPEPGSVVTLNNCIYALPNQLLDNQEETEEETNLAQPYNQYLEDVAKQQPKSAH